VSTVVVTVTPTPSSPASPAAPSKAAEASSGAADASASGSGSGSARYRQLPGNCGALLPISTIMKPLGHAIKGKTEFIVGKADKTIGRLANINCRYGVASNPAMLEIGVSLYGSAADAGKRVPSTANFYVNHGATRSSATVDGEKAVILTGGRGDASTPTLAVAKGQRAVAISLNDPKTPQKKVGKVLTKIAGVVLRKTQPIV
jgi:hypothetical protein